MRGLIGGILTGGLVSVACLSVVSLVAEQPAGTTPPETPLVDAPRAAPVEQVTPAAENEQPDLQGESGISTPVGSLTIEAPVAPDLPEDEATTAEPDVPSPADAAEAAPRADTDPLDEPEVVSIEGAMEAPVAPDAAGLVAEPVAPVLPNPQSLAPQTPVNEADLSVSTTPAQPEIIVVPDAEPAAADAIVDDVPAAPADDVFVVDLGADAAPQDVTVADDVAQADDAAPTAEDAEDAADATTDVVDAVIEQPEDETLAAVDTPTAGLQLQGGANAMPGGDTGVVVRRPGSDTTADAAPAANALADFAADAGDFGSKPLLSIVLIDDGSMSAASAALAGLPFSVTIALDPALENAADLMASYRAAGFEVAALAKLPDGAQPSDVEVTFESVFQTLPESIAVLDVGDGGLQTDRDVTEQAMDILASQGRGFITASQGLNMASRAAGQAGVPAAVVYRDLDIDGQDARVVRRFVDQAAFRARQESGVVLVGRVRPDTISALILWGTANQDDQVAVVPVSAVLNAQ